MRFLVEVATSPEAAFAEVADFSRIDRWDPFVMRSVLERGAALEEGSEYALYSPGLVLRYRLTAVSEPTWAHYEGGSRRVHSSDTITVVPSQGGALIVVDSRLAFSGRMRLLAPLIRMLVWVGGKALSVPAMRRHLGALAHGDQGGSSRLR